MVNTHTQMVWFLWMSFAIDATVLTTPLDPGMEFSRLPSGQSAPSSVTKGVGFEKADIC